MSKSKPTFTTDATTGFIDIPPIYCALHGIEVYSTTFVIDGTSKPIYTCDQCMHMHEMTLIKFVMMMRLSLPKKEDGKDYYVSKPKAKT